MTGRAPGEDEVDVAPFAREEVAVAQHADQLERPRDRRLELELGAVPVVAVGRQDHAGSDLEGDEQALVHAAVVQRAAVSHVVSHVDHVQAPVHALEVVRAVGDHAPVPAEVHRMDRAARRPDAVAKGGGVVADPRAVHEAQRRTEVLLDLGEAQHAVDAVVRVLELDAVGRLLLADAALVAPLEPGVQLGDLVFEGVARAQAQVAADQRVGAVGDGIAVRRQHPHPRLFAEVHEEPPDREILAVDVAVGVHLHVEGAEVPAPDAAGGLEAGAQRHLVAVVGDPDAPREEGDAVLALESPEVEAARVLQEELPRLRKEQVEARQVDAAIVDRGLGEVGVGGERRRHRRPRLVEDVAAGVHLRVAPVGRVVPARSQRQAGPDVDTQPLIDVLDSVQVSDLGDVDEVDVLIRRGPTRGLVAAADAAQDVEAPGGRVRREVQALERDRQLHRPALRVDRAARPPDAVPLDAQRAVVLHQAVAPPPGRADLEEERIPVVVEGIDHDGDAVVVGDPGVARHLGRDDLVGLGVPAARGDVERVGVVGEVDVGALARLGALDGLDLDEPLDARRLAPSVVVQRPVDRGGRVVAEHAHTGRRRPRLREGEPRRCQQHQRQGQRARQLHHRLRRF